MSLTLINPGNQKGLRHVFDILDPQSNPMYIDMSAVQPVIDMSFEGNARLNDYDNNLYCEETGDSIAGVQTKTYRLLSYSNLSGVTTQIVVPPNRNFLLWGMKFHIFFSGAGAVAFNGKYINCEIKFVCPAIGGGAPEIAKYLGEAQCKTGVQLYGPGGGMVEFTRNNIQIVPADTQIDMVWWVQDGSNFPANTVVVYTLYGQSFLLGSPCPRLI
jgi:hypothetical protein